MILFGSSTLAFSGEREILGYGGLLTNDAFGDFYDRWHTSSGVISVIRGPAGTIARPAGIGEVIELRFGGGILTPSSITNPLPGDRRYASYLSLGAHSHFAPGTSEVSLGVDLYATGPQTGLGQVQSALHDLLGLNPPAPEVLAGEISNGFHPTVLAEVARRYDVTQMLSLRPFVEAQAGVESFVRIGGDLLVGDVWKQGMPVRDATTGQYYQTSKSDKDPALSVLVGADVAHVFNSVYLPQSDGYELSPARTRARAGIHWQNQSMGLFYGVTWLGPEFAAQNEGQLVGSVRVNLEF